MTIILPTLLSVLAVLPALVSCHGHVRQHKMNGKVYTGFLPYDFPDYTAPPPSIVRTIQGFDPLTDVLSKDITCNKGAYPIKKVGEVTGGTNITFYWNEWPHSGPMLTFMARCEPNCASFEGTTGNVWFKIDEQGYDPVTNRWATRDMFDNNNTWTAKVPKCLKPGEYLVRHDTIAVHQARNVGGAQFYPSCAQVKVLGQGKIVPPGVAIPGAFQPTDPGVLFDSYQPKPYNYTIPGPPVFKCPA